MNVTHILFGFLILMGFACTAIFFIEETPQEQGFDHPAFPPGTMLQAPEGYPRHRSVIAAAGSFGALTALFVGASLVLGLNQRCQRGIVPRMLLLAAVVYAALLGLVVIIYWDAVQGPASYLLGLPASTSVMMFLLAPSPLLLVILYAIFFPRWIMSAEDEQAFRELVERRRNQRAD